MFFFPLFYLAGVSADDDIQLVSSIWMAIVGSRSSIIVWIQAFHSRLCSSISYLFVLSAMALNVLIQVLVLRASAFVFALYVND